MCASEMPELPMDQMFQCDMAPVSLLSEVAQSRYRLIESKQRMIVRQEMKRASAADKIAAGERATFIQARHIVLSDEARHVNRRRAYQVCFCAFSR